MNPLTGTLHHPERVGHDDPVVMLKQRLWKVLALLACWQQRATQRSQLMGLDARLRDELRRRDHHAARPDPNDHGLR